MEPSLQNAEVAAYVVGAVALLKDLVKAYVPASLHNLVLVALAGVAGAGFNYVIYTFPGNLLIEGALVGLVASGAFKTVKELRVAKK